MSKKYNRATCALGLCIAALAWGCAAPVEPEEQNAAGSNGQGNNDGNGGSGADGSDGGAGGRDRDPIEDLPGVDVPLGEAPAGCVDGDAAASVSLELDADVPAVLLEATDGTLHANGVACTAGGDDVSIAGLEALSITGDGAAEGAVILALGSGDWSALIARPESIQVAFPVGENSVLVRGTSGNDFIRHGMRGADLVLDLAGEGNVSVVAAGLSQLGVSLGDGDDKLDDLSALLAERAAQEAAEAQAEAEAEGGEVEPVEPDPNAPPPVSPLTLPVVALGEGGNDWLLGGSGDDDFDGGAGDDVMSGLAGDDSVFSDETDGADIFNGGENYDYVSYAARTTDLMIQVCAAAGVDIGCTADDCACSAMMSGAGDEQDRIVNVEDVTGGEGNDTIMGSEAADSLSGGPGNDALFGLGGPDLLYGESGDDEFDGGGDGDYCSAFGEEPQSSCEI
jgi:Ca2+-binding RTX toxin-like protein